MADIKEGRSPVVSGGLVEREPERRRIAARELGRGEHMGQPPTPPVAPPSNVLTRRDAREILPALTEVLDAIVASGHHPTEPCLGVIDTAYFMTAVRLHDRLEAYIVSPGEDVFVLSPAEYDAVEIVVECAELLPDEAGGTGLVLGAGVGALVLLAFLM